jgi:hypothetical protein
MGWIPHIAVGGSEPRGEAKSNAEIFRILSAAAFGFDDDPPFTMRD